jgi:hypothetical protein
MLRGFSVLSRIFRLARFMHGDECWHVPVDAPGGSVQGRFVVKRGLLMSGFKGFALAAAAVTIATAAVPASAATVLFGSYAQNDNFKTLRWVNGTGNGETTSSNVGGRIYSTVDGTLRGNPGTTALVNFSFALLPLLNSTPANFTLLGTTSQTTTLSGPYAPGVGITQGGISGSFSYISPTPLGANCTGSCTNLLTATFTNGILTGQLGGSSANLLLTSAPGSTLVFTSDFLNFDATTLREASFDISFLSSAIAVSGGKSLRSTRGVGGANFSADVAPRVEGVPEPEMWALMVAGFGMVGFSLRRRTSRIASITA